MSRHRGAKHHRRYELLGGISLLSPEYLLSVERWPFHSELARYMIRNPFALEKMTYDRQTGMVVYRSKFHASLKRNFDPPLPCGGLYGRTACVQFHSR